MNIPNFHDIQVIDKRGYFTSEWRAILGELFTQLQLNVSNEGFVLPQQTTSNISDIASDEKYEGSLITDSDTNELKFIDLNGAIKTVTVT